MGRVRRPSIQVDAIGQMATHGSHRPRRIILHSTESGDRPGVSDVSGIFSFWRSQGRGYGAHLVIDSDGNTGRGAHANKIVWATFGANTTSYQIELVGFASLPRWRWLKRRRQLDKAAKWCAYQCKQHGIRPVHSTTNGIARHRDFPAGGHTDPGAGFPLDWFLRRVRFYLANGW